MSEGVSGVAALVMAEAVWVLRRFRGHPMDKIRDTLSAFAAAPPFASASRSPHRRPVPSDGEKR